jgi:glycosyltransferase involved in cell wall biosynthesis
MVITCHGTDVRLLERNAFIRWLGRRTLRRAAVVTTVSRPWGDTIERLTGVRVPDARVQPMPVLDVVRPVSVGGGGVVVVGRLSEQKRVDLAIAAYADAREHGLTLPLTIVGDGPTRAALRTMVGGLGLAAHVAFAGEVPPAKVPEYFATADCCLMTAESEGLGLTAAEALMQGVPVVACRDGGGVLDVVPASGAGRVASPEAHAISVALRELLADPLARPAAVAAGEQWRNRLSPTYVAEKCLSWYGEALHG